MGCRSKRPRLVVPAMLGCAAMLPLGGGASSAESERPSASVLVDVPGLLCFWAFQEPAGEDRVARGTHAYRLREVNGPIARADGGIFGPYCVEFQFGQSFRLPRKDCPGLDIHGKGAQVSILAWVQRRSDNLWQFVAGIWGNGADGQRQRQYAIYLSGTTQTDSTTWERHPALHQAHGFISAEGGNTPGRTACISYATGRQFIEKDRWYFIASTYDGESIRVYVNGELDANGPYNPFPYSEGIFDGGEGGSDFHVAQHHSAPHKDREFDGRLAGLAVFNRALSAEEIARIHLATAKK